MEETRRGRSPKSPCTLDTATGAQARPDTVEAAAAGEWTPVGPGGSFKRRAQSPLLASQRATMYRALSPSVEEEDAHMD
eukprot:6106863-Amphidinium_carterae.1